MYFNSNKKRETMTDYPWIKSYPQGVHWDADLPVSMLPQLLENAVAKWADRPALGGGVGRPPVGRGT